MTGKKPKGNMRHSAFRQVVMTRDGLEVEFMPNGIHIIVEEPQKHGHTLLYADLDDMRDYAEKLNEEKS